MIDSVFSLFFFSSNDFSFIKKCGKVRANLKSLSSSLYDDDKKLSHLTFWQHFLPL